MALLITEVMAASAFGGIGLGGALDWAFSSYFPKMSSSAGNAGKTAATLVEVSLQLLCDGLVASAYLGYLADQGYALNSSLFGSAPFWFFFLGAQTAMAVRMQLLIVQVASTINSLINTKSWTTLQPSTQASKQNVSTSAVAARAAQNNPGQPLLESRTNVVPDIKHVNFM